MFWLGPAGALRPLPSPSLDDVPEVVPVRTGGLHRSLTGRPTLDRLGVRRTWTLSWPYLDADTRSWLGLLHAGIVAGPLWLLDPTEGNRLPVQVATAGSVEHAPEGFTASAGTLAWTPAPLVPPDTPVPLGSGALTWVGTGAAQLVMRDSSPVLPGETVTFAASVAAGMSVQLSATVLATGGRILTTITGPPATPGSAGARLSLSVPTMPGAVSVRPAVAALAAGTVTTSAWSLSSGADVPGWTPGGGSSVVLCESLPTKYPVPGSFATIVTLLEV